MLVYGHPDQRPMTPEEAARCDLDVLLDAAIAGLRLLIHRDKESDR
jgi:hypothetical protein